jgi:mannose-6-phosphate isomerase-like protein (cupin superfamily)
MLPFYFHLPKEIIEQTLANIPIQGKRALEPLKSLANLQGLPFKILEDHQLLENNAEVHLDEGDLWYCLKGEVRFVCGGQLVDPWPSKASDGSENPPELQAKTIEGGAEVILREGEWLWIPPGEPHQHTCPQTVRMMIIKIPRLRS